MSRRVVSILFKDWKFIDFQDNDWPWNENEQTLPYSIARDVEVPATPEETVSVFTAGKFVDVYGYQLGVEEQIL